MESNNQITIKQASMQLEIYIHGNPRGFYYLGPANEKDLFFQRFYNRSKSAGKELIIESRQPYFYYTYLLCKKVLDTNGRPNSYFGITIRFDAYYKGAANLFTLLDTLCNKWVIGNLLKEESDSYQYTSNELPQNVYENIQTDLVDWIRRAIDDKDLLNLQNISSTNNQVGKLNLIDSSFDNIRKNLQQYGTISISPDYPLLRENEYEVRIQTLDQQWTAKWNDLQGKHAAAVNNAQGLNNTIQTLQGQLSQAQNNLQRVKREFDEYKSKNKLSHEIINSLKEEKQALLKIAGYVDSLGIAPQKVYDDYRNNNPYIKGENKRNNQGDDGAGIRFNIKPYLVYSIPVVVLVLIIWLLFTLKDCTGKGFLSFLDDDKIPIAEVVEQHQQAPTSDAGIIGETAQQADGCSAVSEDMASENTDTKTTDVALINTLIIDVVGLTNDIRYMKKNEAYTIRICDNKKFKPVDGIKGNWKILSSDFYINKPNSTETTITPIRSGNDLEIQFFVEGFNIPLKRRIEVRE